jgi:hypothetical protein
VSTFGFLNYNEKMLALLHYLHSSSGFTLQVNQSVII